MINDSLIGNELNIFKVDKIKVIIRISSAKWNKKNSEDGDGQ